MAPHQQLAHPLVRHSPHQRHPPLQPVLGHHPLQQGALGAVAANQELQQYQRQRRAGGEGVLAGLAGRQTPWHSIWQPEKSGALPAADTPPIPPRPGADLHIGVPLAQLGQYSCQQVDPFAVHQPAEGHNCDAAAAAVAAITSALPVQLLLLLTLGKGWLKQRGVHSCSDGGCRRHGRPHGCAGQPNSKHHSVPCSLEAAWRARPCSRLQQPGSPFGMTDTRLGGMQARSTVFSLLVWLTQMTCCTSASVYFSTCGTGTWGQHMEAVQAVQRLAACHVWWAGKPGSHRAAMSGHAAPALRCTAAPAAVHTSSRRPCPCLVDQYAAGICKAEEGVVCEDCGQAHGAGMHHGLVSHRGEGL